MRCTLAIVLICAACFSKPGKPTGTDASADGAGSGISYVHKFVATAPGTFSAHAVRANDLIVVAELCDNQFTPGPMTLSAPNWTFTAATGVFGTKGLWVQIFSAIAPDANTVMFDPEPQASCNFEVLADEFTNSGGGGIGIDTTSNNDGTGSLTGSASLTTIASGDAIWAACFADGDCGAVAPFTATVTTDNGNATEYRTAGDGPGTVETASFTLTTTMDYVIGMVAIRPE